MNCLHAMRVEYSVLYRERIMTTDALNKAPAIYEMPHRRDNFTALADSVHDGVANLHQCAPRTQHLVCSEINTEPLVAGNLQIHTACVISCKLPGLQR